MSTDNFDIHQMMETARVMQEEMEQAHQKIANTEFTGYSKDKRVKITMMGSHKVTGVSVDPELTDEMASLESAIAEAVNQAITDIERASKDQLSGLSQLGGQLDGFKDL